MRLYKTIKKILWNLREFNKQFGLYKNTLKFWSLVCNEIWSQWKKAQVKRLDGFKIKLFTQAFTKAFAINILEKVKCLNKVN